MKTVTIWISESPDTKKGSFGVEICEVGVEDSSDVVSLLSEVQKCFLTSTKIDTLYAQFAVQEGENRILHGLLKDGKPIHCIRIS